MLRQIRAASLNGCVCLFLSSLCSVENVPQLFKIINLTKLVSFGVSDFKIHRLFLCKESQGVL